VANPAGDALSDEEIAKALREIVGETSEEAYVEDYVDATCKDCGKRQKFLARMKVRTKGADPATRLNALKMVTEHGHGKPGQAKTEDKANLDIDISKETPEVRGQVRRHLITLLKDSKDPNVQALLKLAKPAAPGRNHD
jgi:hypothetical protein